MSSAIAIIQSKPKCMGSTSYCETTKYVHMSVDILVKSYSLSRSFSQAWISDFAAPDVFPFTGFYIDYPSEDRHRGMVTMTSMTPPAMGWLYVDKDTLEAKYGNKTASIEHIKGPWDWTEDESGVLLEDKEAFVAVQEKPGEWALYFDRREDRSALPKGKLALPISLDRELKDDEPKAVG